ncbi:hypothetical protein [Bradyrhizobium sp. CSS354]|uniref:hypothetical protein n=1 Tax=Bradyrhizobium sp. CSS354 TaxID=2699172 RepID=UPI0023AF1B69|nr:hypothetical protein [Bradyrhizobium sp. CSS354]MDE5461326.1 hypothetical protein [Bradyrhizobium sp. CSS354]
MTKQTSYPYKELQGEILKRIFRGSNLLQRQPHSASVARDLETYKTMAAQLIAAANGWQYQLHPRWEHLAPLVPCTYGQEHLRFALRRPLFFVDTSGDPVAIATQPPRLDANLGERLNVLKSHGLFPSPAPSTYASIDDPGNSMFFVCTLATITVRWLPEQEEIDGLFSVPSNEMPRFRDFIDQFSSSNEELSAAIDCLRRYRDVARPWALPEHIVSLRHLEACLYNVPWGDVPHGLLGDIWALFTAWSRERVTEILTFDREFGS